jgi:hypothetical protein
MSKIVYFEQSRSNNIIMHLDNGERFQLMDVPINVLKNSIKTSFYYPEEIIEVKQSKK